MSSHNKRALLLSLLFIITLGNLFVQTKKTCGHHLIKNQKMEKVNLYPNENTDSARKRFLTTAWQPIRIYIDYTHLDSQTTVDKAKRDGIKEVVNQTAKMFESLLYVKRSSSKLQIKICAEAKISDAVMNGVDADIVLFPFFNPSYTGSIEAAATSCSTDTVTGRPIAGYINYSIENFHVGRPNSLEYFTYLSFHEINHVLVFNDYLWDTFIDANGATIGKSQVVGKETINGVERLVIKTPKVVQAAKRHFGCDSITGVELENQGGEGTVGNHWEMRTMLGDFMIGESYEEVVISDISLAFFEDSGWYKVNYYTGGLFKHGRNSGCDFIYKKCIQNDKTYFPNSFCYESGISTCTPGRLAKGTCYIDSTPSTAVPAAYKYFTSGQAGGTQNADFCPVTRSTIDSQHSFQTGCLNGKKTLPDSLQEYYGSDSACFYSSVKSASETSVLDNFTICYKFACDNEARKLTVTIGDQKVSCPKEGGPVDVTSGNNKGKLYCPDYNLLCTRAIPCKNMFECAINKVTEIDYNYDYTVGQITSFTALAGATPATNLKLPNPAPYAGPVPATASGSGTPTVQSPSSATSSNYLKTISILLLIFLIA